MNSDTITPGFHVVSRLYHSVLFVALQVHEQTQAEAARDLGISVATFQKMLRLRGVPVFHTRRGQELAERLENWTGGLHVNQIFPETIFNKKFLKAKKIDIRSISFRQLMHMNRVNMRFPLPAPSPARRKKHRKK